MNSWLIRWHYEIGSNVFNKEKSFDDIIDFKYCTDFGGNYILTASSIDEYTNEVYPVSFPIGRFDTDYIYYNGNTFYTKDFPMLVKMVYNRNIKHELEVLE